MGEMAEDIMDGTVCSECGCFFVDKQGKVYTHGYPVICWDCFEFMKKRLNMKEKKAYDHLQTLGLSVAEYETL